MQQFKTQLALFGTFGINSSSQQRPLHPESTGAVSMRGQSAGASPRPWGLMLVFGAMYFVQGIAEPGEGLIAQPVRSLLRSWGHTAAEMALFTALLGLPWSLKPVYGLLSDFVPLWGTHRRNYLLASTSLTAAALAFLFMWPPDAGHARYFLAVLILPAVGVAFSDVVVDALMVEYGKPAGLTGRLQSIQWCAMYVATMLTGVVGGWLSQIGRQELGFAICAVAALCSFTLVWFFVREPPRVRRELSWPQAGAALRRALGSRSLIAAAGFVFLWSFNPFSSSVLYVFSTETLGFSEQFYGWTTSLIAVGAVVATVLYGAFCRSVTVRFLIHLSIATGVLSTLAYWGYVGPRSATVVSLLVGFSYMLGNLVLLDVAARACPLEVAGTAFAVLMGGSNLSLAVSTSLGGWCYQNWAPAWSAETSFHALVCLGALTNGSCWLLVPWLVRIR